MLTIGTLSGKRYTFEVRFGRLENENLQTSASGAVKRVFNYETIMFCFKYTDHEILVSELLI